MANYIPTRLINFNVYNAQNKKLGVATVELPEIEAMSESVSGAGIGGEMEVPIPGHFSAMEMTLKWRTIEKDAITLMKPIGQMLTLRGAQQEYDAGSGYQSTKAIRIVVNATPKTFSLGSFEPNAETDTEQTFGVTVLKIYVAGVLLVEIDQGNMIHYVGGIDYAREIRDAT